MTDDDQAGHETEEFYLRQLRNAKEEIEVAERARRELELQNDDYRTRVTQATKERYENKRERLLEKMIPMIEQLEQTIDGARRSETTPSLIEGIGLVRTLVLKIATEEGLELVPVLGTPLDPELCEVVGERAVGAEQQGRVLEEQAPALRMASGRIARKARVIVGVLEPTPAESVPEDIEAHPAQPVAYEPLAAGADESSSGLGAAEPALSPGLREALEEATAAEESDLAAPSALEPAAAPEDELPAPSSDVSEEPEPAEPQPLALAAPEADIAGTAHEAQPPAESLPAEPSATADAEGSEPELAAPSELEPAAAPEDELPAPSSDVSEEPEPAEPQPLALAAPQADIAGTTAHEAQPPAESLPAEPSATADAEGSEPELAAPSELEPAAAPEDELPAPSSDVSEEPEPAEPQPLALAAPEADIAGTGQKAQLTAESLPAEPSATTGAERSEPELAAPSELEPAAAPEDELPVPSSDVSEEPEPAEPQPIALAAPETDIAGTAHEAQLTAESLPAAPSATADAEGSEPELAAPSALEPAAAPEDELPALLSEVSAQLGEASALLAEVPEEPDAAAPQPPTESPAEEAPAAESVAPSEKQAADAGIPAQESLAAGAVPVGAERPAQPAAKEALAPEVGTTTEEAREAEELAAEGAASEMPWAWPSPTPSGPDAADAGPASSETPASKRGVATTPPSSRSTEPVFTRASAPSRKSRGGLYTTAAAAVVLIAAGIAYFQLPGTGASGGAPETDPELAPTAPPSSLAQRQDPGEPAPLSPPGAELEGSPPDVPEASPQDDAFELEAGAEPEVLLLGEEPPPRPEAAALPAPDPPDPPVATTPTPLPESAVEPPPIVEPPVPPAEPVDPMPALIARAEAAATRDDHATALALYDEVLALDPDHAGALAGRKEADRAATLARRRFVPGRTVVRTKESDSGPSGFDTGDVTVAEAPRTWGRLSFEATPPSPRAGEPFSVQVFLENEGKEKLSVKSVTFKQEVDGTGEPDVWSPRIELETGDRELVKEVTGVWSADMDSWRLRVTIETKRGEKLESRLSWR